MAYKEDALPVPSLWKRVLPASLVVIIAALGVIAVGALAGGNTGGGSEYSTYASGPQGSGAFFEYLTRRGFSPSRLRTSLVDLDEREGMIVIIEPAARVGFRDGRHVLCVFSPDELSSLLAWVAEGHTVLMLAADENEVLSKLGIKPPGLFEGDPGLTRHVVLASGPEFEGLHEVYMPAGSRFDSIGRDHVALLGELDTPSGLLVPHGQGRFFVIADSWPISNRGLGSSESGHSEALRFLTNLVTLHAGPGGAVAFDEFHHGYEGDLGVMGFLKRHGQQYAVWQLALVLILAAWRLGARFGRPVSRVPSRARDLTEHVGAVANIYRRARLRKESLAHLQSGLARELAIYLRLPPRSSLTELLAALTHTDPDAGARLRTFLQSAASVDRQTNSRDFVELAREALQMGADMRKTPRLRAQRRR